MTVSIFCDTLMCICMRERERGGIMAAMSVVVPAAAFASGGWDGWRQRLVLLLGEVADSLGWDALEMVEFSRLFFFKMGILVLIFRSFRCEC